MQMAPGSTCASPIHLTMAVRAAVKTLRQAAQAVLPSCTNSSTERALIKTVEPFWTLLKKTLEDIPEK